MPGGGSVLLYLASPKFVEAVQKASGLGNRSVFKWFLMILVENVAFFVGFWMKTSLFSQFLG